ncbi:MAG: N-acetyltransferase protein [Patescibacteria group bacterium]|nr:N-acetyltransferase protein [Patescibacteria group bacterium]
MIKKDYLMIKKWNELSSQELSQMNDSHAYEWKIGPMSAEYHKENIFFLLENHHGHILAQGQLIPINGVKFQNDIYNIFGIGGIIANIKNKGYGSIVMAAITKYLKDHHKTGIGFTGFSGFYEKCGFLVDEKSIKRFVYRENNKNIINTESDRICYLDSDDHFMEKVINNVNDIVYLPRTPDW